MTGKINVKDKKLRKTKFYFLLLTSYFSLKKGQTALELAVFGAILIFVVGAIVRQALNAGNMQNQQLRAMRQAMSTSYRYSTGMSGVGGEDGAASRRSANILFLEDRLTADSAKYGGIDRTPYVAGASASYSRNLFLPAEAGEDYNLPIYDMFINGKHFPFATAAFKTVELARNCRGVLPANCGLYPQCKGSCGAGSIQLYPPPEIYPGGPPVEWEDNCVKVDTTTMIRCSANCNPAFCAPSPATDCDLGSLKEWPQIQTENVGCARLYDVVYNHPGYPEWCDGGGRACPGVGDPGYNLTADERFDLDRDGITDVPGTSGTDRENFSWQWFLVMGFDADHKILPQFSFSGPPPPPPPQFTLLRGAGITDSQHMTVDVDGDLKREGIAAETKKVDYNTGVIKQFVVVDSQDGDLDFTRGDSDPGPTPGLTKDARMFTRVRDGTYPAGTYLEIREGKLYAASGDAGQYIRTTQKKDQIDLIERTIQLSNDTNRFCDTGGNVVTEHLNNDLAKPVVWTGTELNPVEACSNDCFTGANVKRTCMDQDPDKITSGNQPPVIYVRSRVVDQRGRKWVTNTSGDDYVDFTLPSGP